MKLNEFFEKVENRFGYDAMIKVKAIGEQYSTQEEASEALQSWFQELMDSGKMNRKSRGEFLIEMMEALNWRNKEDWEHAEGLKSNKKFVEKMISELPEDVRTEAEKFKDKMVAVMDYLSEQGVNDDNVIELLGNELIMVCIRNPRYDARYCIDIARKIALLQGYDTSKWDWS